MTARSSALRKLGADYEIHDRYAAMNFLQKHAAEGQIVTGVLYIADEPQDLHTSLKTVQVPLNALGEKELCPARRRSTRSTPDCGSVRHLPR